jgi:hypothetical protein
VSWKLGPARTQGQRNISSNATRRAERARAEAEGFARIEQETKLRRERTDKLRKLREARDAEEAKAK